MTNKNQMLSNNLHLSYQFTDRGGSKVYLAFHEDDRTTRMRPLFQVRIHPDSVEILPEPITEEDDDESTI